VTPAITFRQAREAGACQGSYSRMARHVGGIRAWGKDRPVPIETVLDVCGLDDALWALKAVGENRLLRLWAADCAERVLPLWEDQFPDDNRPRRAIKVARAFARGEVGRSTLGAARTAAAVAREAARDIAAVAAWGARAAAWAAAWDAASTVAAGDFACSACAADAAATRGVARAAAWGAERAWQTSRLREYLRGEA
jgi:hypothetical protein